ncbi:GTPase, partial [Actinotignum timonense]|uniref:GTPase n=1 Tax=Actinotignum timonense TaxID=1870995 RepID=UPI0027DD6D3E
MARLRKQIAGMKAARDTKRSGRTRTNTPAAVVVGYTTAGKSSLLNALVGSQIMVADELFATLDPTVRKAETPEGRSY